MKRMANSNKTCRLSFLLIFLCFTSGFSQRPYLKFDHLTTKDGLSSNHISCIVEDHHGFMWFGTIDGLNRWDGHTLKIFRHDPNNSNSLSTPFKYSSLIPNCCRSLSTIGLFFLQEASNRMISDTLQPFFSRYAVTAKIIPPAADQPNKMYGPLDCRAVIISIYFAYLQAIVPFVISIKRLSVVFGVVLGGLIFHEKHILTRVAGALIMVAGSALIALA